MENFNDSFQLISRTQRTDIQSARMSLNFSAHQYDAAFKPRRLGNWEVPKTYPELPRFRKCQPEVIANDRGHLYPKYKCRRKNPFCNYIGE